MKTLANLSIVAHVAESVLGQELFPGIQNGNGLMICVSSESTQQ